MFLDKLSRKGHLYLIPRQITIAATQEGFGP